MFVDSNFSLEFSPKELYFKYAGVELLGTNLKGVLSKKPYKVNK